MAKKNYQLAVLNQHKIHSSQITTIPMKTKTNNKRTWMLLNVKMLFVFLQTLNHNRKFLFYIYNYACKYTISIAYHPTLQEQWLYSLYNCNINFGITKIILKNHTEKSKCTQTLNVSICCSLKPRRMFVEKI